MIECTSAMSEFPGRNWTLSSLSKLKQVLGIYTDGTVSEQIFIQSINVLLFCATPCADFFLKRDVSWHYDTSKCIVDRDK